MAGTRERLRGFVERVRLAAFLRRTRWARVVFALVVTLVFTACTTVGSRAFVGWMEDADHVELDDGDHLEDAGGGMDGEDVVVASGPSVGVGSDEDANRRGGSRDGATLEGGVERRETHRRHHPSTKGSWPGWPAVHAMFLGKSHGRGHGPDAESPTSEEEEEEGQSPPVVDDHHHPEENDEKPAPRAKARACRPPSIRPAMVAALREVRDWRDAFGADVVGRYRWDTCAVVGNSGSLLASKHGDAIDGHSAVFRLNAAPTGGRLTQRVGKKTQLRLLNNAKAKVYLMNGCSRRLPCDPGSTLVAVRGTPFPLATKMWSSAHASILAGHVPGPDTRVRAELAARMNDTSTGEMRPLGKVPPGKEIGVAVPPRNVLGAMKIMRDAYRQAVLEACGKGEASNFFRGPVTPSSGMFAIIIALSLCNSTSVFGFGTGARGGYQYFHSRNTQSRAHSFATEKRLITAMGKSGVVRVNGVPDRREEERWMAARRGEDAVANRGDDAHEEDGPGEAGEASSEANRDDRADEDDGPGGAGEASSEGGGDEGEENGGDNADEEDDPGEAGEASSEGGGDEGEENGGDNA